MRLTSPEHRWKWLAALLVLAWLLAFVWFRVRDAVGPQGAPFVGEWEIKNAAEPGKTLNFTYRRNGTMTRTDRDATGQEKIGFSGRWWVDGLSLVTRPTGKTPDRFDILSVAPDEIHLQHGYVLKRRSPQ